MGNLGANLIQQLAMGILSSQLGDALELTGLTLVKLVQLAGALVYLPLLAG